MEINCSTGWVERWSLKGIFLTISAQKVTSKKFSVTLPIFGYHPPIQAAQFLSPLLPNRPVAVCKMAQPKLASNRELFCLLAAQKLPFYKTQVFFLLFDSSGTKVFVSSVFFNVTVRNSRTVEYRGWFNKNWQLKQHLITPCSRLLRLPHRHLNFCKFYIFFKCENAWKKCLPRM